jgi:hypothetical protein
MVGWDFAFFTRVGGGSLRRLEAVRRMKKSDDKANCGRRAGRCAVNVAWRGLAQFRRRNTH